MRYSKELHDRVRQNLRMFDYPRFDDGDIDALLDEIERLQAERRWIPVSERLPEMYSPVLTMAKKAKYPRVLSREKETKDNWVWSLRQLSGYVAYINPKTVTHWMPLPEPPELPRCE